MTPQRWQQINDVLEQVEAAASEDRASLLDKLCLNDADLRHEVEKLLDDDNSKSFLQEVIGEQAASFSKEDHSQQRFGRYQLIRRIGQGGMGAVYEAVRVDDFHKKVALKIIRQGLDSDYARTRFLQERQLLASLEHPFIARLLDGGETNEGSPFLVLEFVQGEPITQYCEKLDRTARLRLFLKVCEAVEHAHRNLVVHRDLKPANILVTETGDPKLLDFGIAKLLDPGSSQTQTGYQALTPDYASPEQVRGQPITTASDVYSLGVVLYQILTGRKPYDLDTATPLEMDRVICQDLPAAPGLGDELDHIIMMALRKEPDRRYAGIQRLAEDVERYLDDRPVMARPDTIRYRTTKFVRRNWWQLAAIAAVILSLSAGLAFSLREQNRANRRFNQVRELANQFLFEFYDQIAVTPGTVKAQEMVVSTALKYLNSLASENTSDPGLRWEMAVAYAKVASAQGSTTKPSLGRGKDAIASYERAIALARPLADAGALNAKQQSQFADLLCETEAFLRNQKDLVRAEQLGREAEARSVGAELVVRRRALRELSLTLSDKGDLTGGINSLQQLLPLIRDTLAAKPTTEFKRDLAVTLLTLGYSQLIAARLEDAQKSLQEALQIARELSAANPKSTRITRWIFLSLLYQGQIEGVSDRPNLEHPQAAADLLEQALAVMNPLLAADSADRTTRTDVAQVRSMLALALREMDPKRAIFEGELAVKEIDIASPGEYLARIEPRVALADAYRAQGNFARAEASLKEADRLLATGSMPQESAVLLAWARLEAARGNRSAAAERFRQTIDICQKDFDRKPLPSNAWGLTVALSLAAPDNGQRILAVWEDQNRRFPGVPYIERKLAEAKAIVRAMPLARSSRP